MSSIDLELGLIALGAMLSPTTLACSVLALILGERPVRTGLWFYLGALGATLAIGVLAAFVIGNAAASSTPGEPKAWVAIVDLLAGAFIVLYLLRARRRPADPQQAGKIIDRMSVVASSPAVAIIGAGAALANPGGFIPLALKDISELNPSAAQYVVLWVAFALVSLLPLSLALVMLVLAPDPTQRFLHGVRGWLERRARTIAGAILLLLAASLLSHGIAGIAG
jgi:Sap, sulfolipid-1-addressing protein